MTVLSLMLFLEHAILGAWVPLFQLRLRDLSFSGEQISWIYAAPAVASIFAPWIAGQLADRVFSARSVLFVSHLFSGAALWLVGSQTRYEVILLLIFVHAMLYMPTLSVSNMIVFRHLADRERQFGIVRLWGTASWIFVAGLMGLWLGRPGWLPGAAGAEVADCVRLAALLSMTLVLFCVFIPATPPERASAGAPLAAVDALRMFRQRSFAVLMLVSFLLAMMLPFIYPYGGLYLNSLGVSDSQMAPLMSIGQVSEVIMFLLLGWCVGRLGLKRAFLVGCAFWCVRFVIWAADAPWPLVVASLGVHGFCYAFVFGLGQIFVDQCAKPDVRASAQALHQVVTFGLGSWIGVALAGAAYDAFQDQGGGTAGVDFTQFFLWPAVLAAVCFVIFAVLFKTPRLDATRPPAVPDLPM
jgi:nucleoside transporter